MAGHWHTGTTTPAYGPAYQAKLLASGRHIIPWFVLSAPNEKQGRWEYYDALIREASRWKLPIAFVATQWERPLSVEPIYVDMPAATNPNVVKLDGTIDRQVSPFGSTSAWRHLGRRWGEHPVLRRVQEIYPDPPLVLFLSNNEHAKLRWTRVEGCKTFVDQFGTNVPDERKRQILVEGYAARYGALFEGFRGSLSEPWQRCSRFVAYNAMVPASMGRWPGWIEHSLTTPSHLSPWSAIWEGASVPYYTHNWDGSTDCNVWSPQIEAMNWVAAQHRLTVGRPFWFELSTWDGNRGKDDDKRMQYAKAGQTYSPERYGGMVQFGMWLLRPRSVREFRGHTETLPATEAYFEQVLDGVDRVYASEELTAFWRLGRLVVNPAREHPYQTLLPASLAGVPRWYLLSTSLDPPEPWKLHSPMRVFALALVLGEGADRRWLIYAHAPLGPERGVEITVPSAGTVTVDVPVGGGFWTLKGDQPAVAVAAGLAERR
jgi:hypothetical protein